MTAIPDTSDVITLAKSLGAGRRLVGGQWLFSDDQLVAFHDAIIRIAMERAAKLADQEAEHLRQFVPGYGSEKYEIQAEALDDFAFEIRKAKEAGRNSDHA